MQTRFIKQDLGPKLNCEHRTTQKSHKVTFHLVLTCDLCHVCLILPSHNRCPLLFCLNSLLCSTSDFTHQSLSPDSHIHLLTFVSLNSTYTSPAVLQSAATSSMFLCPSALQSSDPELEPKPVPACLPHSCYPVESGPFHFGLVRLCFNVFPISHQTVPVCISILFLATLYTYLPSDSPISLLFPILQYFSSFITIFHTFSFSILLYCCPSSSSVRERRTEMHWTKNI